MHEKEPAVWASGGNGPGARNNSHKGPRMGTHLENPRKKVSGEQMKQGKGGEVGQDRACSLWSECNGTTGGE